MELRQLRYFVAIAEAGSFRRAAEMLHVAQPALSRAIAGLEREIGVALFAPGSRRRVLSEGGEALLADARSILDAAERAAQRAASVSRGEQKKLRIAFTEVASDVEEIAAVVDAARAAIPGVEITMLPMPSVNQIDALVHNRIDAGFLYAVPRMDERLTFHGLADAPVMAGLPRHHPLARRASITLRDLAGARIFMLGRGLRSDFHHAVTEVFRAAGITPKLEEVSSAATVASLVSVGMGIGLLTSTMRSRLPDGVVMRPISDLGLVFRLGLAWCPSRPNPLVARMMAEVGATSRDATRLSASGAKRNGARTKRPRSPRARSPG
jgi:DNA-binding transcriptional LysR family regulator